jgi:hypothetical protein
VRKRSAFIINTRQLVNVAVVAAFACAVLGALAGVCVEARAEENAKFAFTPYGFLRFDVMSSDSQMNNNLAPMWVLNEYAEGAVKDDATLAYHPRLTRLGVKFSGFALSDKWTLDGGVEIDFQIFDAGTESRQVPRMRLGYMRLNYNDLHIMVGQHWDMISTLYPNVNLNGVNWNIGNTGDRRPQIRVTYSPDLGNGKAYLTAGVSEASAVAGTDVDRNNIPDGIDSAMPLLQGWFGADQKFGDDGSIKAGVWGSYWDEKDAKVITDAPAPDDVIVTDISSWSVGLDLKVTATSWLMFQGEVWTGSNLGDIRGGIGQTINQNAEEIAATGGWFEADFTLSKKVKLIGGYTMDDVKDEDIVDGMRAKNQAPYGALRWTPFKNFMLTGEYVRFETTYLGFDETSVNNHIVAHMMYFF